MALHHVTAQSIGLFHYGSVGSILNSTNAIKLRVGPAELAGWTLSQRFLLYSCRTLTRLVIMLPENLTYRVMA